MRLLPPQHWKHRDALRQSRLLLSIGNNFHTRPFALSVAYCNTLPHPSHTAIHFHNRRIAHRTSNSSSTCLVRLPFSFGASSGPIAEQLQLPSLTTRMRDPTFCLTTRPCPRRSPQLREPPLNPSLNPRKKTLTKNRTMSKKTTTTMMTMMTKTTPMNMLSRRS